MCSTPTMRQAMVASTVQLTGVTLGAVFSFPGVMLQQFGRNDSSIRVDFDTASWITTMPGLGGIVGILVPYVMQLWGRKILIRGSCLTLIIGFLINCTASTATTIIVGEFCQGIALKTVPAISSLIISEVTEPKIRSISFAFYTVGEIVGATLVHAMSKFLLWRTIGFVMCVPAVAALVITFFSPESPSWLAYKGRFDECKIAFKWLRGDHEDVDKELKELISVQRNARRQASTRAIDTHFLNMFWLKVSNRDFYIPLRHITVLMILHYWCGNLVIFINLISLIENLTTAADASYIGILAIDILIVISCTISWIFLKRYRNKSVLIASSIGTIIFLICASVINYLQMSAVLAKDSLLSLYCMMGYMFFSSFGLVSLPLSISSDLIPVKHRDLLGSLYIAMLTITHATSVKLYPYLVVYISFYGVFLLYAFIVILSLVYFYKYVPETKGRTLQELEASYNNGHFMENDKDTDEDASALREELEMVTSREVTQISS